MEDPTDFENIMTPKQGGNDPTIQFFANVHTYGKEIQMGRGHGFFFEKALALAKSIHFHLRISIHEFYKRFRLFGGNV